MSDNSSHCSKSHIVKFLYRDKTKLEIEESLPYSQIYYQIRSLQMEQYFYKAGRTMYSKYYFNVSLVAQTKWIAMSDIIQMLCQFVPF